MVNFRNSGLAALLLTTTAGVASADITPNEVWTEFTGLYAGFGIDVTASLTESGADLVVSNIVAELANPDNKNQRDIGGPIELPYDVTLRDLGDGTVELIMPEEFNTDFLETLIVEGDVESINLSQTGLKTIVSGEVGNMELVYTADELLYEFIGVSTDFEDKLDVSVTMSGMSGSAKITEIAARNYLADVTFASTDIKMLAREGSVTPFDMDVTYTDLTMVNDFGLPQEFGDPEDLLGLLEAGFAINDLEFSHKGMRYTYATEAGFPISGEASSEAGTFGFGLTADGFLIRQTTDLTKTTFSGIPGILPPIDAEFAGSDIELLLPMMKSEEPKDYTVQMNLRDAQLGEGLWGMFDPTQELARDPINLQLTATGQANLLIDIFQEEEPAPGEQEGEIHSLSLSKLLLQAAGAELTGQGEFTFDNSDLTSFDGMPRPEGELDVKLTGGNALIDSLVNIGILQQEQVTGLRFMMAAFTNTVEGEDTMTSKLVVDAQGSVFANGQQIK